MFYFRLYLGAMAGIAGISALDYGAPWWAWMCIAGLAASALFYPTLESARDRLIDRLLR
jgi:hypothetical protein